MATNWLSAHIPIRGGIYSSVCDEAVRRLVAPIIAASVACGAATGAFFIRYVDREPHIRLRLQHFGAAHRDKIILMVERAASKELELGERSVIGGSAEWIPYVPEIGRYAGVHALPIVERLFGASSEFAIQQLDPAVSTDRSLRLGRGALAMLVLAHTMLGDRASVLDFTRQYSASYLKIVAPTEASSERTNDAFANAHRRQAASMAPYIAASWDSLETRAPLTKALDAYRAALIEAREQLAAFATIDVIELHGKPCKDWKIIGPFLASSLVHMTSNRLGISIVEESFLARTLQQFFETPVGY
jgi:thiopeptide-type bacteriocin biosynthesis protein